jgi:hypothetical protein
MGRKHTEVRGDLFWVSVDACRVRVQTGEPIVFIDARKDRHRAAGQSQIAGSIRMPAGDRTFRPPCHKRNYIVVYCA